ncbi:hypothetical protein [Candidatus Similichlamydia laticola]|uniref:Uncharacterized protein n=1 Tax=Candidatus Similichlamydia laticola TaxID=2170265 RepID=A0A369KC60_9BACT|nr:hypothetical protein [Candidatus Similichlamydia laticola]RDB31498.1 hypothetical protein HAT2_00372 [Candidatus Similichlamydia laticola]
MTNFNLFKKSLLIALLSNVASFSPLASAFCNEGEATVIQTTEEGVIQRVQTSEEETSSGSDQRNVKSDSEESSSTEEQAD